MSSLPEIIIRTNTITGQSYDAEGRFFRSNSPVVSYKSQFRLKWYLYSETPNANAQGVNVANWTADTSYSECGAVVTCDNDFRHKLVGTVHTAISAGNAVSEIIANIPDAEVSNLSGQGVIRLLNADGDTEEVAYTNASVSDGVCTFSVDNWTPIYTYAVGDIAKASQQAFFTANYIAGESIPASGIFAFDCIVYSEKLADIADSSSSRYIACEGIELLPFLIGEGNTYIELPAFLCDSFGIAVPMSEVGNNPEVPTQLESQIVAIVNASMGELNELVAEFNSEEAADSSGWHTAPIVSTDKYMRLRLGASGTPTTAIPMGRAAVIVDVVSYSFTTSAGDSAAKTFSKSTLGLANDSEPQLSLYSVSTDGTTKTLVNTSSYNATWTDTDGDGNSDQLTITYYDSTNGWVAGNWMLKFS